MIDVPAIVTRQREWERLAAHGGAAITAPARLAMRGLREAVSRIHRNLVRIGYPSVPGLVPPPANIEESLSKIRAAVGALPEILCMFWREVGGIGLVDLDDYAHVSFWKCHGLPWNPGYCDGVFVYACDAMFRESLIDDFEERAANPDDGTPMLEFSPDDFHKDSVSGGAPYSVEYLEGWVAPVHDFAWNGPVRPRSASTGAPGFLAYLRTALLECGGFPGYFGHAEYEPIRIELLRDVKLF